MPVVELAEVEVGVGGQCIVSLTRRPSPPAAAARASSKRIHDRILCSNKQQSAREDLSESRGLQTYTA